MKIFDLDSPLMNVLNKMADLMWLNILTLICCIPIITAGAAFTSMHYVALKIVRNEESYITRSFFKSFKTNFRQATLIWLLILLIAAVLGGDYYIITKSGIQFSSVLVVLIMAAAVLVICTTLYVFPVLAKFDNTIMGTIRNAFIMSILQLPKTVVMFVMAFFPLIIYLVSLRLIPIIFLFGFSLPAYASAMLYNKFFQKLEDQLVSEQEPAPEVSPEEDERVFHDEIDESIKIEDKEQGRLPGRGLMAETLKTADKRCSEYAEEKNMGKFPPMGSAMCIVSHRTGPEHI